ncbi:MAG: carboxypeptidase-like regulatory domain-containing protein [Bryobacteraceae bacterium]
MTSPNARPESDSGDPGLQILIRLGCALLLGLALLAASCDWNRLGAIQGAVVDGASARVPDAIVMVIDQSTSSSIGLRTDSSGEFTASDLKPGKYTLAVRKEGFLSASRSNILVDGHRTLRVELNLARDPSSPVTPVKASAQR